MTAARPLVFAAALLALGLPRPAAAEPTKEPAKDGKVSYYRDIRPIFQQHCQSCHQPAKPQGGYVMTSHPDLMLKGDAEKPNVVPGKPEASYLVELLIPKKGKRAKMPKGKDPLPEKDIELIKRWIEEGAADDTPKTARKVVDADHPPVYALPPVITALDYSPDSTLLAVAGSHEVLLHKADGSGLVARLIGVSERIQSVAFSPDGKRLAVAGGAPGRFGEIQVWEVARKKLKLSVAVTHDTVYGARWSHDGSKISFGCADNTVRAIDAATGKQVLFQGAHSDWVLDTVFSTDGSHLVSVSRDMSMKLTEVKTQRFVDNITSITPGALKGGLMTVDRHPKKDEVVIGGSDGVPKIYRIYRDKKKPRQISDDFNKIIAFPAMPGRVFAARFNPDGTRVIAGSSKDGKGEVHIYNAADAKLVAKLEGQKGPVYAVAWRRDGKQVASAGFDGVVRLSDPATGKLIKEFVPVPLKGKDAKTAAADKKK
jgi:WD40 repeat protein/mono/diheme cytochrome c family protein